MESGLRRMLKRLRETKAFSAVSGDDDVSVNTAKVEAEI